MVAFIVPQVFTAYGIMKITDFLEKPIAVEVIDDKSGTEN